MFSHQIHNKHPDSREVNHQLKQKTAEGIIKGCILCLGMDNGEWSFIMSRIGWSTLSHCGTQCPFLLVIVIWKIRLFCYLWSYQHEITTKFCTCHDNTVVVTCKKFCGKVKNLEESDVLELYENKMLYKIWIWIEYISVKCFYVPGAWLHQLVVTHHIQPTATSILQPDTVINHL